MDREEMDAVINAFLSWIDDNHPDAGAIDIPLYVDDFLDAVDEGEVEAPV